MLQICFTRKVYFDVGELGRFELDQYEVAATKHNLTSININSAELKVPFAASTRQRDQLVWTAYLQTKTTHTDEWAAVILFKDYLWTPRISAFREFGHVTAEFLSWVIMFIVIVSTTQQATLHVKLTGIIEAQQYTRAEMKVRGMSTSPWK
jgi:hypothetical protein